MSTFNENNYSQDYYPRRSLPLNERGHQENLWYVHRAVMIGIKINRGDNSKVKLKQ